MLTADSAVIKELVVPRRGAWIEIMHSTILSLSNPSSPAGGRGLKFDPFALMSIAAIVVPRRGAWIEMLLMG